MNKIIKRTTTGLLAALMLASGAVSATGTVPFISDTAISASADSNSTTFKGKEISIKHYVGTDTTCAISQYSGGYNNKVNAKYGCGGTCVTMLLRGEGGKTSGVNQKTVLEKQGTNGWNVSHYKSKTAYNSTGSTLENLETLIESYYGGKDVALVKSKPDAQYIVDQLNNGHVLVAGIRKTSVDHFILICGMTKTNGTWYFKVIDPAYCGTYRGNKNGSKTGYGYSYNTGSGRYQFVKPAALMAWMKNASAAGINGVVRLRG